MNKELKEILKDFDGWWNRLTPDQQVVVAEHATKWYKER